MMETKITSENYSEYAMRTAKLDGYMRERAWSQAGLLHAALGCATEAGEFVDAMKRHIYYGAPLDRDHVLEELGDLLWYVAYAAELLRSDLDEVMGKNVAKLHFRYPGGFSADDAVNRDTAAERSAMEVAK